MKYGTRFSIHQKTLGAVGDLWGVMGGGGGVGGFSDIPSQFYLFSGQSLQGEPGLCQPQALYQNQQGQKRGRETQATKIC